MKPYRKFKCSLCEHVYDEERGDVDTGIAPGTRWENVPDDGVCPDYGAPKVAFDEI